MSAGPLRFDRFQEQALYDPDSGFFARGSGAGRRGGDFITSPEVGPLFGEVLARALRAWWEELGAPAAFDVVEVGAGRGALAASVLRAVAEGGGGFVDAMRYTCVERSASLRDAATDLLGDRVEVTTELPTGLVGVVVANELLDNLPVRILERVGDRWQEVHVADGEAVLMDTDLDLDVDVEPGTRLPVHAAAGDWVRDALAAVERGRVVAIDYGVERTAALAGRVWLRTYRGHERGDDALSEPGTRDITVDVAFDQLPTPDVLSTQAEFLGRWGIDELVEEGRRIWTERASIGDLAAVRARSRVTEADALLDPSGLGAFLVAEWIAT